MMEYYSIVELEWDPRKAAANKRKHGVSFEEAATSFEDEYARFYPDLDHEDRFVLIGSSRRHRLVYTVHAEVDQDRIRIISARLATRPERKRYEEET
jgi:uncharacterized DUF497 family protein